MKLLFDQNVSPALVRRLDDLYPKSAHVSTLGLDAALDAEVRDFAAANNLTVVTKDADFSEMLAMSGFPPKVVWIRRGNCSTRAIEEMLRRHHKDVRRLIENDQVGLLMLF